jgi:S1-C subfamily serine protease
LADDAQGVMVLGVAKGSAAAHLGIGRGDFIVAINNQDITNIGDIHAALSKASGAWRISINRGGQTITVVVQ